VVPYWLVLALLALTVYRFTRLVTADDFPPIHWAREHVMNFAYDTDHPRWEWLGDLVSCQWCASGWVALVTVVSTDQFIPGGLPLPVLWWLAAWGLGAVAMNYEDRAGPAEVSTPTQLESHELDGWHAFGGSHEELRNNVYGGLDLSRVSPVDLVRHAVDRVGVDDVIRSAILNLTGPARERALRTALRRDKAWYDLSPVTVGTTEATSPHDGGMTHGTFDD
jgi:hypothetical protein